MAKTTFKKHMFLSYLTWAIWNNLLQRLKVSNSLNSFMHRVRVFFHEPEKPRTRYFHFIDPASDIPNYSFAIKDKFFD